MASPMWADWCEVIRHSFALAVIKYIIAGIVLANWTQAAWSEPEIRFRDFARTLVPRAGKMLLFSLLPAFADLVLLHAQAATFSDVLQCGLYRHGLAALATIVVASWTRNLRQFVMALGIWLVIWGSFYLEMTGSCVTYGSLESHDMEFTSLYLAPSLLALGIIFALHHSGWLRRAMIVLATGLVACASLFLPIPLSHEHAPLIFDTTTFTGPGTKEILLKSDAPHWQKLEYWQSDSWAVDPWILIGQPDRAPGSPFAVIISSRSTWSPVGGRPYQMWPRSDFPGVESDGEKRWREHLDEKLAGYSITVDPNTRYQSEFYAIGGSVMTHAYGSGPQLTELGQLFTADDKAAMLHKTGTLSVAIGGCYVDAVERFSVTLAGGAVASSGDGIAELRMELNALTLRQTVYTPIHNSWGHQQQWPPDSSTEGMVDRPSTPFQIFALLDPARHEAHILNETRREISREVYSGHDRVCFESHVTLPDGTPFLGMRLEVFEIRSTGPFTSTIVKENITVSPNDQD